MEQVTASSPGICPAHWASEGAGPEVWRDVPEGMQPQGGRAGFTATLQAPGRALAALSPPPLVFLST